MSSLERSQPRRRDEGYSLTELLVSMTVFSILIGITFGLLIQMTYQSKDTLARVRAIEEAKIGISQIDRQVRSGNVILDPGLETFSNSGVDKWFSMRIYTQVDGTFKCAQWRVNDFDGDGFGNLEFRSWSPGTPSDVTPWAVVAHNLVKMDVAPTDEDDIIPGQPETWPPFWVDPSVGAGTESQFVRVTLRLKDPSEREGAKATSVSTVITGRNTIFGYTADHCSTVPSPD